MLRAYIIMCNAYAVLSMYLCVCFGPHMYAHSSTKRVVLTAAALQQSNFNQLDHAVK